MKLLSGLILPGAARLGSRFQDDGAAYSFSLET